MHLVYISGYPKSRFIVNEWYNCARDRARQIDTGYENESTNIIVNTLLSMSYSRVQITASTKYQSVIKCPSPRGQTLLIWIRFETVANPRIQKYRYSEVRPGARIEWVVRVRIQHTSQQFLGILSDNAIVSTYIWMYVCRKDVGIDVFVNLTSQSQSRMFLKIQGKGTSYTCTRMRQT